MPDPPAAPIDDDTELMTPAEVQRELRISPSTLRRWANDGDIEVVRLPSGHRRYPAAVVTAIRRRIPDPAAT
ncbi:hypothetical protein CcI49_28360 [Frankia sp. CcI49]|uniref:MerR family transcriptional regulator n=1 Tax=Frankia sp. CcI49 TaxID=1745382 RepID=UPI0009CC8168|nr:helix-turn-helix domain-containing protein [Frankia sp. CcI49]ONH55440.1 hypothetical protein CcI49_28360 [Frankia sp. CcI49]